MQQIDSARGFAPQNSSGKIGNGLFAGESKNIEHIVLADSFSAKRNELIEHRLRVAQTTFGSTRNRMRGRWLKQDFLLLRNELKMFRDQVCRNAVEIKPLAPAQNGWENFLRLCGREDEFHMLGRFLESF